MTDDMLDSIARDGGVVQVNYYSNFLSQSYRNAAQAQKPEVDKAIEEFRAMSDRQITYCDLRNYIGVMVTRYPAGVQRSH